MSQQGMSGLASFWAQMVALDWVIVVLVAVFAVIGYASGFVVGLFSVVGFLGGAVVGILVVPELLAPLNPGVGTALLAVLLVVLAAALGQWAFGSVAGWVRERFGHPSARRIDGIGGALVAVAGFLVVAWFIGVALASAGLPALSVQARGSYLLRTMDSASPVSSEVLREQFRDVVAASGFPDVVAPFVPEQVVAVPEPNRNSVQPREMRAALPSVVRVTGQAPTCERVVDASGAVVSPGRVLTNAHVVAGTDSLQVRAPGELAMDATVVHFDPDTDVAVLDVPELKAPALERDPELERGDGALVAGYPGGGRLRTEAARVRSELELVGLDIYRDHQVRRSVVALRADVRPGSSGGPLLSGTGEMQGLIFAASLTSPDTAYALSLAELEDALAVAAEQRPDAVGTQGCV